MRKKSRLNKETVQSSWRRNETPVIMLFGILPCSPDRKQILISCLMPSAFSLWTPLSVLRIIERFGLEGTSGPHYSSGHGQLHTKIRLLQAPSKRVLKIPEDGVITTFSRHLLQYWTALLHGIFLPNSSISFFTEESWDESYVCMPFINQTTTPCSKYDICSPNYPVWPVASFKLLYVLLSLSMALWYNLGNTT